MYLRINRVPCQSTVPAGSASERALNRVVMCVFCSLYDSDVSQDWYSPSYSPPDHAYTPTGDAADDEYASDYDYNFRYNDDDWRYDDNRRRGTGRKLPAPPPTTADYGWQQTPTPTVNGDYITPTNAQPIQPVDTVPPSINDYTVAVDQERDYSAYNGYYNTADNYYDGSDGYDRTSEMYDENYYMSFDGDYGDSLVNGYTDGYIETAGLQEPYYDDYGSKPYEAGYQQPNQYVGTERTADVDERSAQYPIPGVPSSSPALKSSDAVRHDAIYDDGYVDRDGVYHHYDYRRYDDERYYDGKYVASIASDAGESAYDVDELNDDVMSSVPARSSIDSSATPALRYDRYYDVKPESFESYDRDVAAYDAAAVPSVMKDSGYQTYNQIPQQPPPLPLPLPQEQWQQQALPPEAAELPYFNHVDVSGWPVPAVNGDVDVRRSPPVTVIDAQTPAQSFVISHPAENTSFADQRWSGFTPPVSYADGLARSPTAAGYCDTVIPASSVDSSGFGY